MTNGRIASLQALRAVAATAVVVTHALGHAQLLAGHEINHSTDLGAIGVDVFFVLSGYIITRTARAATSGPSFFARRWLRVAPLSYVLSLPVLVWLIARGEPYLHPLIGTLFFWPVGDKSLVYPLIGPGWTLCFEMVFYTSVAFLVGRGRASVAAMVALFAVFQVMRYVSDAPVWTFLGNPMMFEFALGAALTQLRRDAGPRIGLFAAGLALVLIAFVAAEGLALGNAALALSGRRVVGEIAWVRLVLFGLPSAVLVWSALQLEPWVRGRVANVLVYLGDASYSIYLAHALVLAGILALAPAIGLTPVMLVVVDIVAALAAGVVIYQLIERPLLAYLRRPKMREALAA